MRVLVIGPGGREHALAWKIKNSPLLEKLYCAPGNGGTAKIAENVNLDPANTGALAAWAVENKIDLSVVGPEAHLASGLVDVFQEHGLTVFGPTKAASQLESSKAFAKDVMKKAGVPTPEGAVFTEIEAAKVYVKERGAPIVIKADGLAAGKGVVVAETLEQALSTLDELMEQGALGDAGKTVVIEEKLTGQEASIMALVDGDTVLPLVVTQDYKRLLEQNQGPNTGGMGAVSPTPVIADEKVEKHISEIFLPVLRELNKRGIRYTGFLYGGVMVNEQGEISVLEFNCRMGDPETQVIMMRLQSDLLAAIRAGSTGRLSAVELRWHKKAAACIVASSRGYPKKVDDGKVVSGLFDGDSETMIFHAGTVLTKGEPELVMTKGGRVLSVTALGGSVPQALENAYAGLSKISFDGMHYRKDIGEGT